MGILIVMVPAMGGAMYQSFVVGSQRARLAVELAASRTVAREVVDELVVARRELQAREDQVERLLEITALSDDEIHRLRAAVSAWQRYNGTLAQTAERRIGELTAQGAEAERLLGEAWRQHDDER